LKDPLIVDSTNDLNKLKEQTSKKSDITLNPASNEDTFSSVENIFLGGALGGQMTKTLIEIAERQLVDKYKKWEN